MNADRQVLIALNGCARLSASMIYRLLSVAGRPKDIFNLDREELALIPRLNNNHIDNLKQMHWQAYAESELTKADAYGCRIITVLDEDYPKQLKAVDQPPLVLYFKGAFQKQDDCSIAVVGSRQPSRYGIEATGYFCRSLAGQGYTIVSGLAYGIDAVAHHSSLQAKGRTLAVVAHGLDRLYPKGHKQLSEQICQHGAVVSEFPFGMEAKPFHFPRRNRVISGLSLGVLVIEAKERSGALITARWAGEQGRDVFALPGPYDAPQSRGCHKLINDGAKCVATVEDILTELGQHDTIIKTQPAPEVRAFNKVEKAIADCLVSSPKHIDQLSMLLKIPVHDLFANLLTLEMKGVIISQPGQLYQLNDVA